MARNTEGVYGSLRDPEKRAAAEAELKSLRAGGRPSGYTTPDPFLAEWRRSGGFGGNLTTNASKLMLGVSRVGRAVGRGVANVSGNVFTGKPVFTEADLPVSQGALSNMRSQRIARETANPTGFTRRSEPVDDFPANVTGIHDEDNPEFTRPAALPLPTDARRFPTSTGTIGSAYAGRYRGSDEDMLNDVGSPGVRGVPSATVNGRPVTPVPPFSAASAFARAGDVPLRKSVAEAWNDYYKRTYENGQAAAAGTLFKDQNQGHLRPALRSPEQRAMSKQERILASEQANRLALGEQAGRTAVEVAKASHPPAQPWSFATGPNGESVMTNGTHAVQMRPAASPRETVAQKAMLHYFNSLQKELADGIAEKPDEVRNQMISVGRELGLSDEALGLPPAALPAPGAGGATTTGVKPATVDEAAKLAGGKPFKFGGVRYEFDGKQYNPVR